ncbi:MAG: methyltransferase domain-containing protein [Betaproteobacteria bacterium]|nr:methyltransferase domain-containing protein [Betaproteobacteria bacterium]
MPAGSYHIGSAPPSRAARFVLALLERIQVGRLDLIAPDGIARTFDSRFPGPHAMIRLSDWEVCGEILRRGDIGFGETYMARRWDTPDLAELLTLVARNYVALEKAIYGRWWGRLADRIRHLMRSNRRIQAKRNIRAHYDLGNEFYRLWLDETMTYSCAMFEGRTSRSLGDAQRAKYERICEHLDLRPGQRVLEIGCGWGGFAEHAAKTRACYVHGLTLSREQRAYACERIAAADLDDLVKIELRDYRDVRGEFDHVVSIEMFEAVGERYWPVFFDVIRKRLRTGGRALIQTIVIADERFESYRRGTDFIQKYIFPGGMLPSEEVFRDHAARKGLLIGARRALGLDYAATLRHWRHGFNRRVGELNAMGFDERFIRMWNFYLAYCEGGFRAGTIDLVQQELKRV